MSDAVRMRAWAIYLGTVSPPIAIFAEKYLAAEYRDAYFPHGRVERVRVTVRPDPAPAEPAR
jgi:hypothetical protein